MVSGSLSLRLRGSFHLSLTVLFSIAHSSVFSLGGWSRLLPTGFLVSRRTQDSATQKKTYQYRDFTFSVGAFHRLLVGFLSRSCGPTTPLLMRFGLLPFRSPLLGKSLLFSFPLAT